MQFHDSVNIKQLFLELFYAAHIHLHIHVTYSLSDTTCSLEIHVNVQVSIKISRTLDSYRCTHAHDSGKFTAVKHSMLCARSFLLKDRIIQDMHTCIFTGYPGNEHKF